MKISIVVSTQPASFSALAYKGELENNVRKIAGLGYDGVELAVRDPELLDMQLLQDLLKQTGLEVPAIGTGQAYGEDGLSFTSPREDIRQQAILRIKKQIELAAQLRAEVIIGLIRGKVEDGVPYEQAYDWLVAALSECTSHAERYKVALALEPINRYETNLITTVEEGLDLIEKVGSTRLGLLLDSFHMNIEEPLIERSVQLAGNRIFHFHVADSNRWYPGAGHLDFQQILTTLRNTGYAGYLSAEILPLPDADTCAKFTIANLRALA